MKNVLFYSVLTLYIAAPFIAAAILHQYNILLSTNVAMALVVGWYSIAVVVALLNNRKR